LDATGFGLICRPPSVPSKQANPVHSLNDASGGARHVQPIKLAARALIRSVLMQILLQVLSLGSHFCRDQTANLVITRYFASKY